MIASSATPMGRATTPTPGAQSRWPRAVAQLHLALRSPAARSGSSGRWMGCFRPAPVPAPSSPAVTVAVNEGRGKRPEATEVDMEPARGGGDDLWSVQAEAEVAQGGEYPEHLVVMVNGLVGSADDWKFAAEQFVRRMPDKVIIHRSQCNSATQTFDGVDLMGERFFHQLPFLCGLPFLERRASETAHLIVGRTGKHLFLTDSDDGRRPLLLQMVQDHDDIKFRSGLRSFKRRVAYANANFDHMVGWRTSSIRRQHELPKHRLLVRDEKYPHIVHVDRGIMDRNETEVSANLCGPEEEMIRGLTQLQWERVDVSFQKSSQRLVAHNTIQRYLVQETTKGFSPDDHIARMTRTAQL
ncbi:uncharacterized protein [Triticum aestivum]|uniref:uncharacterized protein isoform X4 n=1 Tax=Triticum aestivum TaxID=4565 RepID=UPI001D029415|nr:uncharacterized protein LOC123154118 isoform X4 [Triticum aestivum]